VGYPRYCVNHKYVTKRDQYKLKNTSMIPIEKAWQDHFSVNFLKQNSYLVPCETGHKSVMIHAYIWQLWGTPCLCIHNLTQVMRQMPKTCWGKSKIILKCPSCTQQWRRDKGCAFCNTSQSKQVDGKMFKSELAVLRLQWSKLSISDDLSKIISAISTMVSCSFGFSKALLGVLVFKSQKI